MKTSESGKGNTETNAQDSLPLERPVQSSAAYSAKSTMGQNSAF